MKLGDSVRSRQGGAPRAKPRVVSSGPRRTVKWRTVIPATIAALLIPFAVGYAFSVFVMFPAPKVVGSGGIAVPNLIGHTTGDAEQMLATANLGSLVTALTLPHPSAPAGEILAQDPLPGQQLKPGSKVSVSVSSGAPEIRVPEVSGFMADAAEGVLRKMGFDTQRLDENSPSVAKGAVIRIDPSPGSNVKLPATIRIMISTGPGIPDSTAVMPDTIHAGNR